VNLREYKGLLLVVTAILALLVASPALERLLVYPQTESFTELWLLGPGHMAENFPSNVTSNSNYNIYLGIANHLGSCAYYTVEVKFRNQTQSAPDPVTRTPSSLQSLYNVVAFVADEESWELPVTFSVDYAYSPNAANVLLSKVNVHSISFNGARLNLDGFSATWDPVNHGFFGYLFFELWIYNDATGGVQYHQRSTWLKLNMTIPA
jgi:hypothetical protein